MVTLIVTCHYIWRQYIGMHCPEPIYACVRACVRARRPICVHPCVYRLLYSVFTMCSVLDNPHNMLTQLGTVVNKFLKHVRHSDPDVNIIIIISSSSITITTLTTSTNSKRLHQHRRCTNPAIQIHAIQTGLSVDV